MKGVAKVIGRAPALLGLVFGLAACSTAPDSVRDYRQFYESAPYTVVVLPAKNMSTDAEAPRYFLSTITRPLVDRGYYVIPVEVTAEMLAAEGLAEGGALEHVNPKKFREYFGADSVLYVTINQWDTTYVVFASSVTVAMHYRLVHTDSGEVLWEEHAAHQVSSQQSNKSGGLPGLIAGLISDSISAAVTAAGTEYVELARIANQRGLASLPPGPYNPSFEEAKKKNLEAWEKAQLQKQAAAKQEGGDKSGSGSS
jgi:hypothetical protein